MGRYFKRYRGKLVLWMLADLFMALCLVFWSFFVKHMADTVYAADGLTGIQSMLILGVTFLLVCMLTEYGDSYFRARFLRAANGALEKDLMSRILHYDINAFNSENSAKYISILNNDVRKIDEMVFRLLPQTAGNVICASVCLVALLVYNPWNALICVITTALQFLPPLFIGKRAAAAQQKYMESLDGMNAEIKDTFTGFEVIKSFGVEEKIQEKSSSTFDRVEADAFRMRITQGKSIAISEGLVYFGCIVQMIFCAYLVIQGEITMGILLGALQIANYVVNPARQITSQLLEYKTVKPVIARVVAVLDGEEQVEATEKVSIAKAGQIQVEGLRFSYEENKEVLHGLNYRFQEGKKYAVVGGSGSGKTTLIRLLMGYYSEYTGGIYFDGVCLDDIDRQSLYQPVAMIHQKVFLFEDTIRNNITMFQDCPDEQVWQAIHDAGLTQVVERMGHGLDSMVEENGRNLSGGEQQRIAIARAFARGTEVMLVDEATASLDPQTASQINQVLLEKEGLTLIAITHRTNQELLEAYDEVLVLEQGKLLEHGSYESLSPQRKQLLALH